MRRTKFLIILGAIFILSAPSYIYAKGAGTSGGLTLLEASGARAAALGEAFSAASNDIAAFTYNPASLISLKSGQASFLYQSGLVDDSYGQFMIGSPFKKGSLGLSLGYYNGGNIDLFDGTTERTVNAQTDLVISLGYARDLGRISIGGAAKFLRSELIETASAQAYAVDVGLGIPVGSRLRLGTALQNFGTTLKFIEEGDNLPRIARLGASYALSVKKLPTTLLVDAPYFLNEAEVRPAVGVETLVGPLALRAGYKQGSDLEDFSIGAGFMIGRSSLDYSFGMVDSLDSRHRVSLSMRFGGTPGTPAFVKKTSPRNTSPQRSQAKTIEKVSPARKTLAHQAAGIRPRMKRSHRTRRIYVVRQGDTLSKIAKRLYGNRAQWKEIYTANRHLLDSPSSIEVGQRIILP